MSALLTTSSLDKIKKLDVNKQTGLVLTKAKDKIDGVTLNGIVDKARNSSTARNAVLSRLTPLNNKIAKKIPGRCGELLTGDAEIDRLNARERVLDRLSRLVKDRSLLSGKCAGELTNLSTLMDNYERKKSTIRYKTGESTYANYTYNPEQQFVVTDMTDTLVSVNPDLEVETLDTPGQFAINNQLVETAADIGATAIIKDVLATTDDVEFKRALVATAVDRGVAAGEISMLTEMLDDPTTFGVTIESIKGTNPDWAESVMSGYSLPATSLATALTTLDDFMDRVSGGLNGGWWLTTRQTSAGVVNLPNLELFQKASPDARKLFNLSPILRIPNMIADSYPAIDLIADYKRIHPLVHLQ